MEASQTRVALRELGFIGDPSNEGFYHQLFIWIASLLELPAQHGDPQELVQHVAESMREFYGVELPVNSHIGDTELENPTVEALCSFLIVCRDAASTYVNTGDFLDRSISPTCSEQKAHVLSQRVSELLEISQQLMSILQSDWVVPHLDKLGDSLDRVNRRLKEELTRTRSSHTIREDEYRMLLETISEKERELERTTRRLHDLSNEKRKADPVKLAEWEALCRSYVIKVQNLAFINHEIKKKHDARIARFFPENQ